MQKTVKILSYISVAILVMSSVALLACLLLQEPLCQLLYRASDSIISETPCVPVGQVVYLLGNLAAAFFLLLSTGKNTTSFGSEIICAVSAGAILPFLRSSLFSIQTYFLLQFETDNAYIALSYVNNLCNSALSLVGIAVPIMLVLCGIRIAKKYIQKKQTQA